MSRFRYRHIEIDAVSKGSVVLVGDNVVTGVKSQSTGNDGFGDVPEHGHIVLDNEIRLIDRDVVDAGTLKRES